RYGPPEGGLDPVCRLLTISAVTAIQALPTSEIRQSPRFPESSPPRSHPKKRHSGMAADLRLSCPRKPPNRTGGCMYGLPIEPAAKKPGAGLCCVALRCLLRL